MSGRLLWVDDEIDLLNVHIIFLQKKGYEVTSFVDNQRRVHDHHGIDDPVATSDYGGYRYFVYADGSCERLEF